LVQRRESHVGLELGSAARQNSRVRARCRLGCGPNQRGLSDPGFTEYHQGRPITSRPIKEIIDLFEFTLSAVEDT
jgi:hypothetical protein